MEQLSPASGGQAASHVGGHGVLDPRERGLASAEEGKDARRQLEVDFVANRGSERYYIQSAWMIPDEAKRAQEKASLLGIGDSFKKILLVGGHSPIYYDDDDILTIGLLDFPLNPESLSK